MPLERVNLARGQGDASGTSSTPSSSDKFAATPDELRAIQKKMKDPVFLDLMHDYMKSLEDPETRREEEAYLEQAEREAREGGDFSFEFVFPRPAYVVELLEPSNTRVTAAECRQLGIDAVTSPDARTKARSFLNVCQSDKVKAFTERTTGDVSGSNWEVPVSVSQRRVEFYRPVPSTPSASIPAAYAEPAASQPCILHDVVFHPSTLALAERSTKFMCFLTEIAVEHLNNGYGEDNGFQFRRLPSSIVSIGTPQNQTLRTQKGTTPFATDPRDAVLQRPTKHIATTAATPAAAQKRTEPAVKASTASTTSTTSTPAARGDAAAPRLPPHTITHRGSIDLTDAWRWSVSDKRVGVPEELVVKLTFAEVRRAAALDIAIVPDGHALRIDRTEGQPLFEGLLVLPFTVEETPTNAQFDRTRGVLTLTLKVVPPPLPDGAQSAEELRRTLPGAVGQSEDATTEADEEKEGQAPQESAVSVAEQNDGATADASATSTATTTTIATTTTVPSPSAEGVGATETTQTAPALPLPPSITTTTATSAAQETEVAAALPGKPEVAHIGNQDRVAAMMAQVEAARAARAAAAAEMHDFPASSPAPSGPEPAVQVLDNKTSTHDDGAAGTGTPPEAEENIPFIRKADARASATDLLKSDSVKDEGDDAEAVRARQQAWAAMMDAEMQVARAREEAEAAEAARAAEVQAVKARRKMAAEKEQERLEQLAQAKRDAMPLSNKYIFAID